MSTLPVITSPLLDLPGVRHAFFTRRGGVSQGVYDSLNVGRGSGDDAADVIENRARTAAHFGLPVSRLETNYQIHSSTVVLLEEPDHLGQPPREADGLATNLSGVILGALAADCAPILMVDPVARVVGAAHAGWKGALAGIAEMTITAMVQDFDADPARIVAVVGPCIGQASYEVGQEFLDAFIAKDTAYEAFFAAGETAEKRMFDLPGFVLSRLRASGVRTCEWIGHDTCAEEDLFFSNRRAFKRGEKDFGRLLSAIVLD